MARIPEIKLNSILPVFFLMSIAACATIGPSSVQLSAEVGERISEMENLHLLAVQKYFDIERKRIEDFLTEKWEPLFLKNFLAETNILADLQNVSRIEGGLRQQMMVALNFYLTDTSEGPQVVDLLVSKLDMSRAGETHLVRTVLNDFVNDDKLETAVIHLTSLLGTDEAARMILDFAEDAHHEMLVQRQSIILPLEQFQQEIIAELSAAYAEILAGQSAITGRLEAAARLKNQQDHLLDALVDSGKVNTIKEKLANLSAGIGQAISKSEEKLLGNVNIKDFLIQQLSELSN
jgi:hypothetical protein